MIQSMCMCFRALAGKQSSPCSSSLAAESQTAGVHAGCMLTDPTAMALRAEWTSAIHVSTVHAQLDSSLSGMPQMQAVTI